MYRLFFKNSQDILFHILYARKMFAYLHISTGVLWKNFRVEKGNGRKKEKKLMGKKNHSKNWKKNGIVKIGQYKIGGET